MSAWAQAITQGVGRVGNEAYEAKQLGLDEQQRKLQLLQSQMGLKELQQRMGLAPQEFALRQKEEGIREQEAKRLQDEFELRKKLATQPSFLGFQKVGGRVVYGLQNPDGSIAVKEAPGFDESKEAGAIEQAISTLPPGTAQQAARAVVTPYIMGGDYTGALNALKPYMLQMGKSGMPTETITDSEQWIQSGDKWIKVPKRSISRKGVAVPSSSSPISGGGGGGGSAPTSPKPGVPIPIKSSSSEMNRADLAKNVNENLDAIEEIAKRRPDLFGKISGRTTAARAWLGTDDKDIATLEQRKDNLGRALQGAHGMRAASGVENAANSVVNSFKNGQNAVLSAIAAARGSVQTFITDASKEPTSSSKGNGKVVNYKIVNGELVPQ